MPANPIPDGADRFDLRSYVDVLRRRWRLVAAVTAVGVILALGLSLSQSATYRVEADILLDQRATEGLFANSDSALADYVNAGRQLTNEVESLMSGVTRDAVAANYDGPLDPRDVSVAQTPSNSDVVSVNLTANDADEAAQLLNLYLTTFVELRRTQRIDDLLAAGTQIQQQIDDLTVRIDQIRQPLTEIELQLQSDPGDQDLTARRDDLVSSLASTLNPLESQRTFYQSQLEDIRLSAGIVQSGGARVLTMAEVPTDPIAPNPVQNAIVALILGLIVGVFVSFVRDSLDERILSFDDVQRAAPGVPVLAAVPVGPGDKNPEHIAVRDDSQSAVAEAVRSLRTSVMFAAIDRPMKIIQLTSSVAGEGKTTIAANLAVAMAQSGKRVAVMCCDLRRPRIHERFGMDLIPGLTDVVLRQSTLPEAVRRVEEDLVLLPAGTGPPNPSELLSTTFTASIVRALAEEVDIVILDSTPLLPVTDALVTSRLADATFLVVDTRTTKRNMVRQSLQLLEQVNAPIAGLVLNGTSTASGYGYGYGYGYAEVTADRPKRLRRQSRT